MTVLQRYSNVVSTYKLVVIAFVPTIASVKIQILTDVCTVIYHCTLTGGLSAGLIGITIYVCFQNDSGI